MTTISLADYLRPRETVMRSQATDSKRKTNHRGRPPIKAGEAKRSSFNTRLRTEVKDRLSVEASNSGRSLSEEIERRLERSFEAEKRADEIADTARQDCHAAFGGKGRYHIFQMIADVVADVEEATEEHWLADQTAVERTKSAIVAVIEGLGPKAPTRSPRSALSHYAAGKPAPSEIGKAVAKRRLKAIIGTDFPMKPAKKPE